MHFYAMSNQIKHWSFFAIFFALIFSGFYFSATAAAAEKSASLLRYSIIRTLPHDTSHYTEGLIFHAGKIYESVGRYGASGVYEKESRTGRTMRNRANSAHYFGEGLALSGNKIFQLSWREHTAFIYDLQLRPLKQLHYDTEGWGLASLSHSTQLVMSDGSSQLRFLDSTDLHAVRQITVHDGAREIPLLNELEEADGLIYANVWLTDLIAVIEPGDGRVTAWLDLSSLKASFIKPEGWDEREHVLNGIAYDPATRHFFVTGKCWPVMFELTIEREGLATQPRTATPQNLDPKTIIGK